MTAVTLTPVSGRQSILAKGEQRVPFWLRSLLRAPLEIKLLGANVIILGLAALALVAPARLLPGPLTDGYCIIPALLGGTIVNLLLVRLALRPVTELQRVAKRVSEGRLSARVPASI